MRCIARFLLAALALCGPLADAQPTGRLNDTGQTQCFDGNSMVACTAANTGDASTMPRQDARFGRDAAAAAGQLTKVGGGAAGFDFTALDANHNATTPGSHVCVRDNVTNLIWSTETIGNVTWAAAQTAAPTYSRCGFTSGWRVPTRRELLSIVHHGAGNAPTIDTTYFPAAATGWYWSSDTYAPSTGNAWIVDFGSGTSFGRYKPFSGPVRLVHSGS